MTMCGHLTSPGQRPAESFNCPIYLYRRTFVVSPYFDAALRPVVEAQQGLARPEEQVLAAVRPGAQVWAQVAIAEALAGDPAYLSAGRMLAAGAGRPEAERPAAVAAAVAGVVLGDDCLFDFRLFDFV
jgi:hypothetical protein